MNVRYRAAQIPDTPLDHCLRDAKDDRRLRDVVSRYRECSREKPLAWCRKARLVAELRQTNHAATFLFFLCGRREQAREIAAKGRFRRPRAARHLTPE